MHRILGFTLLLGIVVCLGAGCAKDYNAQVKVMNSHWLLGDYTGAAREATTVVTQTGTNRDAIVWRLEQGTTLRAAGQLKESIAAFNAAEKGVDDFEAKAKVKISQEVMVALTNPALLPYEGYSYDKIMLNTYKASDYLQLGDFANARVEFNRARERQVNATAINAARIEKVQAAAKAKKKEVDLHKVQNDPQSQSKWNAYYRDLDEIKPYANYVNPFTEYLSGLFFMCQATSGSDLQQARKSFEDVLGMTDKNQYVADDLKLVEAANLGQPIPPTTYVIFETGCAPVRDQITIDIPLPVRQVPYVALAFPKIVVQTEYVRGLQVKYGDTNETTSILCNMDSVVAQEFKNGMPLVITRAVASAAIKAGVFVGIDTATKDNFYAELAAKIAWAIYVKTQNIADMRTWNTLPKQIQICHFPTPADRKITLTTLNLAGNKEVTIDDGTINVVWVKSSSPTAQLSVSQSKLK